ncbi:TlpA disulfide reductase family protein [Aestuariibaculum sp. YM273]|uniref:TlpA family protein disulfide reductase n=1 Tax=Aestuariibaculum sp. YM273 TaxID=3070659 RepID=UPI0027DBB5D6|nr:TlpA disulfide reductase family protein [Aestuariibaculum sp. YM273]WMI65085.1 TlpA disulfide reductase family protein [Aestuariibaculum sp. YM273]
MTVLFAIATFSLSIYGQNVEASNIVQKGEQVPDFSLNDENGQPFTIANQKGSIVLINFFATWCGPCVAEMPLLQDKVWLKYKDHKNFKFIAIGRGHNQSEVIAFKKKYKLGFPVYGDQDKSVYSKFATGYIPRNYIIDAEGTIVYASVGFTREEFKRMTKTLNHLITSD